jgi:hypothetical protein
MWIWLVFCQNMMQDGMTTWVKSRKWRVKFFSTILYKKAIGRRFWRTSYYIVIWCEMILSYSFFSVTFIKVTCTYIRNTRLHTFCLKSCLTSNMKTANSAQQVLNLDTLSFYHIKAQHLLAYQFKITL